MNELVGIRAGVSVKARTALERDFEARLAVWSSLAFRVAYSVLRQREDAEDVAQDVLTRAHRKLRQLRDPARLQEWIVRMAWRMAINKRASNIRRIAREEAPAEVVAPPSPEDVALSEQRSEQVWSAIDGLPEKLRIVVVLASIQGHDLAEVSSALGIPEGTVKSRLFEARKQLRERLR